MTNGVGRTLSVVGMLLLAGLFLGGPGRAAEEEFNLKKTPRGTLKLKSGREVFGIFERVGLSEIEIRTAPGAKAKQYETSAVSAIVTTEGTYTLDKEGGRWILSKAPASVPTAKKKEEAKKKPDSVAATAGVVAEGVGTTVEEARKDAIQEAVRKAVGALVVGETVVKDDKVIKDKVLTYSDGVLVPGSYKELSKTQEGEVWRVKITAKVANRKLADRLTEAGFQVKKIDGADLMAGVTSRAEARKQATELLRDRFGQLAKVLVAEARKPGPRDYDDTANELRVDVQVRVDAEKYTAVVARLVETLNLVCTSQLAYSGGAAAQTRGPTSGFVGEALGVPVTHTGARGGKGGPAETAAGPA